MKFNVTRTLEVQTELEAKSLEEAKAAAARISNVTFLRRALGMVRAFDDEVELIPEVLR